MIAKIDALKNRFESAWLSQMNELYGGTEEIQKATLYAALGSGKRIRPLLAMLACDALQGSKDAGVVSAIAIEMVHTYSLVHDDLPSMDNDDSRRGRPTTHIVFPESLAILAGDSLLTDAFNMIAQSENIDPIIRLNLIAELSQASGGRGMVLGQGLDIDYTGKGQSIDQAGLFRLHRAKTGALIGASLAMGAIAADRFDLVNPMRECGEKVGIAFQIVDDLLDNSPHLGKTPGKDAAANKLTFLKVYGALEAEQHAKKMTEEAKSLLTCEPDLYILCDFIDSLLERKK